MIAALSKGDKPRLAPGDKIYDTLLKYLSPANKDARGHLVHELRRLETFLEPRIKFYTFYEDEKSDIYVERESAVLDGIPQVRVQRTHRDLVRFKNENDPIYTQYVVVPIKTLAQEAQRNVERRLARSSARFVQPETLKAIKDELGDIPAASMKKKVVKAVKKPGDFVLAAHAYLQWAELAESNEEANAHLLITGLPGRGKTAASLAMINDLSSRIEAERLKDRQATGIPLLAYFFCEDDSTAEQVLKSLLFQLIEGEETLAFCAKHFVAAETAEQGHEGQSSSRKPLPVAACSVENLWRALLQMLADLEDASRRAYIVICNMHRLDYHASSTLKLFENLRKEVEGGNSRHRWCFGLRNQTLSGITAGLPVIDLDANEYSKNIRQAISEHASQSLEEFRGDRSELSVPLLQWSRSTITKRAPNNGWVDLVLMKLSTLPVNTPESSIRRALEKCAPDFAGLMNNLWITVGLTSRVREPITKY
jgi:Cdc6-like AAA superfamily ATPase